MDRAIPELEQMRGGVSYRFAVKIRNFVVDLRPLTMDETTSLTIEVAKEIQIIPSEARSDFNQAIVYAKAVLKRASSSEPNKNDEKLSDMVLGAMTPDEVNHCYKQYMVGIDKCNPSYEDLPLEVLNKLVEEIKKNPSELTGSSFSQLLKSLGLVFIQMDEVPEA